MKLTPLDIHHKEFNHALRGYNEAEVDAFLDSVADELERLFKENIDLSERNDVLEARVRDYQDMERTLHNTLLSAQKSADEMMQKVQREAEVVLKDAEVKAKEVIHNALTSKQKATADLGRIKQAEEEYRQTFKALLERQLRGLAELPLPEDVKLMVGRTADDTVVDADVFEPAPAFPPVAPLEISTPEPLFEPMDEPEAFEPPAPESATPTVVASLHLGDLGTPDLPPDATIEFDVAEFGFGERDDDVDIEEID